MSTNLPEDVVRYVSKHFHECEREIALHRLQNALIHDGQQAGPRLLRCVVIASNGKLERLNRHISQLSVDWRDVIMAGEYTFENNKWVQLRDLSKPIEES